MSSTPSALPLPKLAPPATEARPVTETLHGVTITDPYRWLEDQNSPETRAWIDRQNAHTDAVLGNAPMRAEIANRLEQLLKVDSVAVPIVRSNRYFYLKRRANEDVYSIYMRDGLHGEEQRLIDPAPMNPKHTTNVGIDDVTQDGNLLAYYVREGGADETEVRFFDVAAKRDVGTPLPRARRYGVVLSGDGRTVYYSEFTEPGPRVFRRSVSGGAPEKLFGDAYTPDKIIYTGLSEDGRYLLIHVLYGSAAKKTEVYLKDLRDDGPIVTVVNDLDYRSYAELAGDQLVIQTNWNAPNERVMVAPAASPDRANWRELVPENKEAALQGLSLVGHRVWARYLENVRPRVIGYSLDGTRQGEIAFEQLGTIDDISGTWSSPVGFYLFTSFNLPKTIYAFDPATGKREVFDRPNTPIDPSQFTVEQLWYQSKDGTRVPMFVMYKKGLARDGTRPTYLTGYGGFLSPELPYFSALAVVIAEHGGVYALANLRGGSEFGEAWHQAGMLAKKQNVFDDFIGAAETLIAQKFTSPEHLAIGGTSNGGLLVTAAVTQRPDLFKAVYVGYPLVDMLRYHQFLVGSFWVPEYGSSADPEQFRWLYAYSPYQHVAKGTKYPAMLFVTGDADTRVAPLHARKMTALMQASTGSDNPVLLRYHTSGGHSGGEPLSVTVRNESELLAFLLNETK